MERVVAEKRKGKRSRLELVVYFGETGAACGLVWFGWTDTDNDNENLLPTFSTLESYIILIQTKTNP